MYGRDEHRDALVRITKMSRSIEDLRDELAGLRADLHDDAPADTADAIRHLRDSSLALGSVLAALDNAATDLPTPLAR